MTKTLCRIFLAGAILLAGSQFEAVQAAASETAVVEQKSDAAGDRPKHEHREKTPFEKFEAGMGLLIGFVAVVLGIGIGFFAIWTEYAKRKRLLELCHAERMAALEKGLELPPYPPDWYTDETRPPNLQAGAASLKPALVWLGIGIAAFILLKAQKSQVVNVSWSAVPIAIGVALLVSYVMECRQKKVIAGESTTPR